jgi:hypothetical protein
MRSGVQSKPRTFWWLHARFSIVGLGISLVVIAYLILEGPYREMLKSCGLEIS